MLVIYIFQRAINYARKNWEGGRHEINAYLIERMVSNTYTTLVTIVVCTSTPVKCMQDFDKKRTIQNAIHVSFRKE